LSPAVQRRCLPQAQLPYGTATGLLSRQRASTTGLCRKRSQTGPGRRLRLCRERLPLGPGQRAHTRWWGSRWSRWWRRSRACRPRRGRCRRRARRRSASLTRRPSSGALPCLDKRSVLCPCGESTYCLPSGVGRPASASIQCRRGLPPLPSP